MSAPLNVTDQFTTHFSRNWELQAGQKIARLQNMLMVKTGCTGKEETHNQVGHSDANETTGTRYASVALDDLNTQTRWIRPRQFNKPSAEDVWDPVGLLPTVAPRGKHMQVHMGAFGRSVDDAIIAGLGGTAYTGADGTTATALPSTQKVAKDFVLSGSASDSLFPVFKIIRALRILSDNDVIDDDELSSEQELFGVMTPAQEEDLRNSINSASGDARLFSKDFAPPVLDERGRIKRFLGVNWKVSTRSGLVDTSDTSVHYAYIWVKSGMQLAFWSNFQTTIDRLPQNNNATLFLSQWSLNAARLEEEKVVEIASETSL